MNFFKSAKVMKRARYGYYGVTIYLISFFSIVVIGLGVIIFGSPVKSDRMALIGVGIIIYGVLSTMGWLAGRYILPGHPVRVARKIVTSLSLKGSEMVLDIGTGRGLYAIEVAKRLTIGRAIGIDVWEPETIRDIKYLHKWARPTGNSIRNACLNAEIEGVGERTRFINMDANSITFGQSTFDLVVCGYLIGHLGQYGRGVLKEIHRVLKPDGKLVLIDNVRDLTYFLLSTPHLFLLSYIRRKKAYHLNEKYWTSLMAEARFSLTHKEKGRGLILIEAVPIPS